MSNSIEQEEEILQLFLNAFLNVHSEVEFLNCMNTIMLKYQSIVEFYQVVSEY